MPTDDEQDLPSLRPRSAVAVVTALQGWLPPDHLAYFISDIVDQLDLSEITARYGGRAGQPSLQSEDDGQGAALWLLNRGGVLPKNRHAAPRGHRLPGPGGQQHAGFPHRLRPSQRPSGGPGESVRASAGPVPAGRAGQAGPRGTGRDQGQSQRLQAQGDELSAYEGEGSAVGVRGGGVAAAGPRGG